MRGPLQHGLRVPLIAAAALLAWRFLPGTVPDRAAFTAVARGFANPPFVISGNGSHAGPWKLRTLVSKPHADFRRAPLIVSLGDDAEGLFQSSPPSPVDLAVILSNFHRLGARRAATAAVLAWDAPDVIGLAALDKALGRFDSLVMAVPLTRGAVPEAMPAAFRNASVSVADVAGGVSLLPVVNRIALPGIILGGENTLAGFQTLDSEPASGPAPLLARWEDRVVFAFPLLVAMQSLDLPLAGMEIRPGESLKLGPQGPLVPLDRYGRLAAPLGNVSPPAAIPAEALIDGGDDLFPQPAPEPVILRDDRRAAEPATREFSKQLPALVAAMTSDCGLSRARDFPRLPHSVELILLALAVAVPAWLVRLPAFARNAGFLALAAAICAAQFIAAGSAGIWLPGLAMLAAPGCALLFPGRTVRDRAPETPARQAEVPPASSPVPSAKKPRKRGKKRR